MKVGGAIVLAGGYSRRMGTDKALLSVGGRSLLERACGVAASVAERVVVVTPWPDRYRHLSLACEFVQEPTEPEGPTEHKTWTTARGPLAGFSRGLQALASQSPQQWVVVLACDLPRLEHNSLDTELLQLSQLDATAIAYLHPHPKGWEPLCGFYRSRCLISLQGYLATGGRSFQRWLATQTVASWKRNTPQLFFNCNTPEDFQRALSP